jgi:hypothetical protein
MRSALLSFALTFVLSAPLTACNLDDINIDFDPMFEEIACKVSVGDFQSRGGDGGSSEPEDDIDDVALNGIRASPFAPVPVSSEVEYALTFVERPSALDVQASGALEVVEIGSVECGPLENDSAFPYVVNLRVRSAVIEGAATLAVSLDGEEVATFDLSVVRAQDLQVGMFDPADGYTEVTALTSGQDYLFVTYPVTASGDPLYRAEAAVLEALSGAAEISPYWFSEATAYTVRPLEAGELRLGVTSLGITEEVAFTVTDPM